MTHEEQANEYVDMFRPYSWSNGDSRQEEFDSETKSATECAINHVEGLKKETMRRSRIDELTIVLGILEQRINK